MMMEVLYILSSICTVIQFVHWLYGQLKRSNAVLEDRVCAGRSAAPVAARLQRDVKIGSGCILGAVREGVALGVKAADVLVPALSDDAAVLDNDAADHGVGVYMTRAACGERQSTAHIVFFLIRHQNHLGEK